MATFIKKLKHAPFPYRGKFEDTNIDFYDYTHPETGRKYHTIRYGTRALEKGHYDDNRVAFHIPPHFDVKKPFYYVVYFHGNRNEVLNALRVHNIMEQVDASRKNVILIALQMAKNTIDVSAGKLYRAGAFKKMMDECADVLIKYFGVVWKYCAHFKMAPMILVAYSGGYKPAAFVLDRGGVSSRIAGLILFDAMYGETEKYQTWLLKNYRRSFFVCLYTKRETKKETESLMKFLCGRGIPYRRLCSRKISREDICFSAVTASHDNLPLKACPKPPLAVLLHRVFFLRTVR